MKLTVENLTTEYPKIREYMPKDLNAQYDALASTIKFYGKDEQITKAIDLLIEVANQNRYRVPKVDAYNVKTYDKLRALVENPEMVEKAARKFAQERNWEVDIKKMILRYKSAVSLNSYKDMLYTLLYLEECNYHTEYGYFLAQDWDGLREYLRQEEEPQPKPEPQPKKPQVEPKTKRPKAAKTKSGIKEPKQPKEQVNSISPSVKFIARYAKLHEKPYNSETKEKVRKLLTSLQKAIMNLEVRKTDIYAKELNDMQDSLIAVLNNRANESYVLDIKNIERYREIARGVMVSPVVSLLQSYIRLVGQSGVKDKAKSLLSQLQTYYGKPNKYYLQISDAIDSLRDYINDRTDVVCASQETLEGLHGLCGIDEQPQRSHSMNAAQLSNTYFRTINLSGKWRDLIGKPSSPYRLMIYGKAGSGKSTLALQYAGYLAETLGQKVLYVASEEGLNYTLKEKLSRLGISTPNLQIVDALPKDLKSYDTVFIDSVNFAGFDAAELRKLNPKCSYVFVFQSTKQGNFRGTQEFLHDVDTSIRVENMKATTEKNRFGAQGTCRVL